MGKGSGTVQSNVPKKTTNYSDDIGAVAGAGGQASDNGTATSCLISVTESIDFSPVSSANLTQDLEFVMIVDQNSDVQLVSKGVNMGTYTGKYEDMILKCVESQYKYRGKVLSVSGQQTAKCRITGYGRT